MQGPCTTLGWFYPILGGELCMRLLQHHQPLGPCSSSGDQRDFTVPGPLQGALSKGVSWSQIKMSFYWRSASFKECRIYWSGCWLLATCCYLSIPLSSCFLVWFGPNIPSLDLSLFHLKMMDGSLPRCDCDFFFSHFLIVPSLKEQLQGAVSLQSQTGLGWN